MLNLLLAVLAVGFVVGLVSTRLLIKSALNKGIIDRDSNKPGKPVVAAMGGFAIFGGMSTAILFSLLWFSFTAADARVIALLLAGLASIAFIALIGVFDDLFKLSGRTKLFLPLIASLPLVVVLAGDTSMALPFIGEVNLGLFYTFVLIPLGITGAANAVNMSAGYNGLEAGIGGIASFFLLMIALSIGSLPAAVILAACLGACLAFLFFNWCPAKVFPGDIGTYVIGCSLAAAVIIGNMEKFGVIVLIPAFYELIATVYYAARRIQRRRYCHNPILRGGKIIPPAGSEHFTLAFLLLGKRPMSERNLVLSMLGLYALCGAFAWAVFFLHF